VPSTSTGSTLPHLPSVCVGNEIDLSASYWHHVATKLDTDTPPYAKSGATGLVDSPCHSARPSAISIVTTRLLKTRNADSLKYTFSPSLSTPYGFVMMRSCTTPYSRKNRNSPATLSSLRGRDGSDSR
jgi:hypothetical protein